jgi:L-alanine-DL-glutamate epimerase-like enolase superfamily enzyme
MTNTSRREFAKYLVGGALAARSAQGAPSRVKITSIETIALADPGKYSMTLVRVRTDAGIDGIGQTESPSLVIDAAIRTGGGLQDLLRGEDPLEVERLWQKMYDRTGLWGRRGVTVAAIGAVETALWDIAGKILEQPVSHLIWRSFATVKSPAEVAARVRPYATVYPSGANDAEVRSRLETALARGFRAIKFEETPGGFAHGTVKNDVRIVELVRRIIGDERDFLIDVQNIWKDVPRALATAKAIEPYNIYFLEAALPADNLDAYRRLAEGTSIPIAAGDWGFTTRFEFADLMERGGVDVVQPSTVRSGGISEILKIAEMAFRRGLITVPHCWNHMVGVSAAVHIAAVTPNMPYFEYPVAFPPSPVISELLVPELAPEADGWITVPKRPGLGFTLNEDVVKRFRVPPR